MQKLKYALRFIKFSFQRAVENEQLQKPWMIFSLGSLVLILAAAIPLALVVGLIGLPPIGMIFIGLISTFLLFGLRIFGEVTALSTSQIFNNLIRFDADPETPGESEPFLDVLARSGNDVAYFRLTYPILRLFYQVRGTISKEPQDVPTWLNAGGLVLPMIAVEQLATDEATKRVSDMIDGNLLRWQPSFIPVDIFSRIIEGVTTVAGIVLGFVVGIAIARPTLYGSWRMLPGCLVGLLIASVFTVVGIAFSTFIRACYHTALYCWAENVAAAQQSGGMTQVSPPKILRQVLETRL